MARGPNPEREAAERLLHALKPSGALSCELARILIPALVEAEFAGEDVDTSPVFAPVLRAIDHCPDCAELYAQLAADMEALLGDAETAAALEPTPLKPPTFFTPTRASEHIVVRVLQGVARQFDLSLATARLLPAAGTLSGGRQINLFTDHLSEVSGAPLVSVSLQVENDAAALLVAVREAEATTRWEVRTMVADQMHTATTDDHGIARFAPIALAALDALVVRCVELLPE